MQYAIASVAFAAFAAAIPQGVTDNIAPSSKAPEGCESNYDGEFQIQVVNVTQSGMQKRQDADAGKLLITLKDGVLMDAKMRTGYIADNRQFQFDGPAQTGAIYTAGWSVCQNGSLALGDNAIFQQCLSGDFYNLYDEANQEQCTPVYIDVIADKSSAPAASQQADGQPTESPVSQIADGQIQEMTDGQVNAPMQTGAPVSQIGDGQIQASTSGAPVSQIGDGQIQASTAAAPVSQIADGQIQASTGAAMPVSQIGDGQIQAPTGSPVQQIPDGQIQSGNGTAQPSAPMPYTGAASSPVISGALVLALGALAIAL